MVVRDVFSSVKDNLTRVEGVLVSLLSVQAIVVQLVPNVPSVERIVSGAFGVASVLLVIVKNTLANLNTKSAVASKKS